MALSLNQIVDRLRTLALAHKQIKSFYFGAPGEFDIQGGDGDVTYPALFCEKLPGSTNRAQHQHQYNFRLYFYDLVGVAEAAEENETDVLSDMDSVGLDFLAMLMSATYQDDWMISDNVSEESREEQLGDMVAGSVREVGILIDFLADSCQVPQDTVTFNEDFDMARTKIITYDATGSEGNSWSVSGIAGKIVIAAYRAGLYKRTLVTVADSEEIQLVGTVLDNNQGIATTGVIILPTGDAPVPDEKFDFLIWD